MVRKLFLLLLFLGLLIIGLFYLLKTSAVNFLGSAPTPIRREVASQGKPPGFYTYPCEKGKTVFELLEKKVSGQVVTKDYSFGKLVEAIDGLKGGQDGKYWLYFVGEKSATISADAYHCQGSESVEWRFEAEH